MTKKIDKKVRYEASKSRCRHKHGSALVFKGSVISTGRNRIKWPRASIHAEIDVILGVPKKLLFKSALYVARLSPTGEFVYSKPCDKCRKLLRRIVKTVYYTDKKGKWVRL